MLSLTPEKKYIKFVAYDVNLSTISFIISKCKLSVVDNFSLVTIKLIHHCYRHTIMFFCTHGLKNGGGNFCTVG